MLKNQWLVCNSVKARLPEVKIAMQRLLAHEDCFVEEVYGHLSQAESKFIRPSLTLLVARIW